MASGLGAIILVLILVKQDVDRASPETDLLNADLVRIQQQDTDLKTAITSVDQDSLEEVADIAKIQARISSLKSDLMQKSDVLSQKALQLSAIKETLKNAPKAKKDDVVCNDQGGEENYIMGIKVEGEKIVFLIDSSASMTDEKLIDIIRRKSSSEREKKRGPKWKRTARIVRWLLARSPESSQLAVVSFNKQAQVLGGGWFSSRDTGTLASVYNDLDSIVPAGSTNLQRGLKKVAALNPTDIYLVTDGLPTDGISSYASLNPFAACGSLLGRSNNISGPCRVKLFRQTLADSAPGRGTKINVILLPIEGDPNAAPEYWRWTAATGGLLISPASSWP